ncbi:MAG: VWA domain-containing protein [Pirellulales bacterium]|nr:VWA domain-containing protein [Pirellulales bacterium]
MMGFRFLHPWWLLLLVPIVAAGIWLMLHRRRSAAVLYSSTALLQDLPITLAQQIKRFLPWLFLVGLMLLTVALARPQRGKEEFRVRAEGIAIEMVADRSGSMRAEDFQIEGKPATRLAVVKKVFHDFVAGDNHLPGRPDDQIGLVAFGGFPEAKCPLTFDHEALLKVLEDVKTPEAIFDSAGRVVNMRLLGEESATAIGDALALAAERLKDVKAKSKVIILLSDGRSNAGVVQPLEAAEAAKALGIKIYTIGIGTSGDEPVPITDPLGQRGFLPPGDRFDEGTLQAIAQTTGGKYFSAENTAALRKVYADIDRLEKTTSEGRMYTQYREFFPFALFPGLGLIVLELIFASTRFRSLP